MRKRAARWLLCATLFVLAGLVLASCGSKGHALSVDLRTDVAPGSEFGSVVTSVSGSAPVQHGVSESSAAYVAGQRVADFDSLDAESIDVTVTLLDPEGSTLVSRVSRISLKQDYALTVVVTRSCAGVICPIPAGDPALTTCAAGQCARPECTPDTPSLCPAPDCTVDSDCRSEVTCLSPRCDHGTCLFPSNDALCPAGLTCHADDGCVTSDGKPACTPTETKETSCGNGKDDDCDGRIDCLDENCGGAACEDGDRCTTGETCQATSCTGAMPASCEDGNDCTADTCDPKTGCAHAPADGPCDDGDACTAGDTCQAGVCHAGGATTCDDGNPCTDDACDKVLGCSHTDNKAPCDDGNGCTAGDVCSNGVCKGTSKTSCDDGDPCTDDSCVGGGCMHAANTAPCDDGVFCNGADTCQAGSCAVHPGSPCKQTCSEPMKKCIGCMIGPDCGPVTYGAWGICGGFVDACSTTGTQSRTVTTPSCSGGVCSSAVTMETQPCTRDTAGMACGAPVTGAWGACGGFADTCATAGTQTRPVTTPTCAAGVCTNVMTTESQACSRPSTDNVTCAGTTTTAWGACGGFASACDTTGTQSRTVTTHKCSGGTCGTTKANQTQSCSRTVGNGTSCGSGNYCCGGSCVSKSSNSHCGSCGAVCQSGHTCGQPVAGEWGCHCVADSECAKAGYGAGATCYTNGGSWCNCQCPGGATSCGGLCSGGATCHDVFGQNYCSYP